MKKRLLIALGALAGVCATAALALYVFWGQVVPVAGLTNNYLEYLHAPAGTIVTELAPGYDAPVAQAAASPPPPANAATDDWASFNKTLTSNRYSPLAQIDRANVGGLKVLCTYDTGQHVGFNAGLLEVNGALIGTTEHDIFSIDPSTCHQNWRMQEVYTPASIQNVNRGAAYMDGRLFRGTQDGRVLAYDFKTGKRLWQTTIADGKRGESAPAAPIAWNGLVFIGNAGGDVKGVKGRMYALDAKTGAIVWEFYLVPKSPGDVARGPQGTSPLNSATWKNASGTPITGGATWTSYTLDPVTGLLYVPGGNPAPDFSAGSRPGSNLYSGSVIVLDARTGAYKTDFKLVPKDWHDWDVSSAPALIHTWGGKHLLSVAPKDGHLYGFDLATGGLVYRTPVTKIENAKVPFEVGKPVHFCPGSTGGAEWNGPAYDPQNNFVLIGEVEWCTTVTLQNREDIAEVKLGTPWSANATPNPYDTWGKQDAFGDWAGWVSAVDADTGAWKWRIKTNYPILSGMTPTAGGIAFFGDMGGNFYAVDSATGKKLWGRQLGGAIGGGVIAYTAHGSERIAVAAGLTEILWPTQVVTAKVVILGLATASATH